MRAIPSLQYCQVPGLVPLTAMAINFLHGCKINSGDEATGKGRIHCPAPHQIMLLTWTVVSYPGHPGLITWLWKTWARDCSGTLKSVYFPSAGNLRARSTGSVPPTSLTLSPCEICPPEGPVYREGISPVSGRNPRRRDQRHLAAMQH